MSEATYTRNWVELATGDEIVVGGNIFRPAATLAAWDGLPCPDCGCTGPRLLNVLANGSLVQCSKAGWVEYAGSLDPYLEAVVGATKAANPAPAPDSGIVLPPKPSKAKRNANI